MVWNTSFATTWSIYEYHVKKFILGNMFFYIFNTILVALYIAYSKFFEIIEHFFIAYFLRFKCIYFCISIECCKLRCFSSRSCTRVKNTKLFLRRMYSRKKVYWNLTRNSLYVDFSLFIDIKFPNVRFRKIFI